MQETQQQGLEQLEKAWGLKPGGRLLSTTSHVAEEGNMKPRLSDAAIDEASMAIVRAEKRGQGWDSEIAVRLDLGRTLALHRRPRLWLVRVPREGPHDLFVPSTLPRAHREDRVRA